MARLEGPNVLPEDEPSEVLADLERSDEERADAVIVAALIDASGLDELIDKIATERELLFGHESKNAPVESNEGKHVKERLSEILAKSWDRNRLHRHYVDTFLGAFQRENARSMLELLKLPAARSMHVDFITLTKQSKEGFKAAADELRKGDDRVRERLALFERIDQARRLLATIETSLYTPKLVIRRVVNELQPAGQRMSVDKLERDQWLENYSERPQLKQVIKVLLAQHYRDRSNEEIGQYAELVETDAFRWFSEQESDAFSSMVTLRFAAGEAELRSALREVQKSVLDIARVETEADMAPAAVVQSVLDAYGVELVFKYLMSKSDDSKMTIESGGNLAFHDGRPPEELITPRSILADLERFGIGLDRFRQDLENRAIAAGIRERQFQTSPRRSSRAAAQ